MAGSVNITSKGIQKVLKHYTPKQAIAEYIWNGLDAGADTIHLNYTCNELGTMESLVISDNGKGIDMDQLTAKFNPFYDSEKAVPHSAPKHTSLMHGKNGVGRLTFFTFAHTAQWRTVYLSNGQPAAGSIRIAISGLNTYQTERLPAEAGAPTGTSVSFQLLKLSQEEMETLIIPHLMTEFCWFLELQKEKGVCIFINGLSLNHVENIEDLEEDMEICYEKTDTFFRVRFIQWKNPLPKELSKYYFLNDSKEEVYKDYTTLNKKCDEFYHSVYIQSNFFNDFDFKSTEDQLQADIFGKAKSSPEYKYLIKTVNEYLRAKRKPYLRVYATRLVDQYEREAILPVFKTEEEERMKKPRIEKVLMALYETQPRLFSNMNLEQKRMMVRMIALMLDSNKKQSLFALVDSIIDMEPEEKKEMSELMLHNTGGEVVPFEAY
jgi:hypothetical protein